MRRTARRVRLLPATLAILLAAAACGDGDSDDAGGEPDDAGGGAEEVAGELRVVHNWTGPEGEAFQAVIDGFEEANPDVTVELEQVPFDQTQSLLTQQFAQGDPPDVAVGLPGIVRNLADQDLLLELDDVWDTWVEEGAYTDSLRAVASAGLDNTYAVYFKGNVNGLIWYTPAQLEQLGLQPPQTWEEFTAAMDQAAAEGIQP
ncbi:MAG: ABC transporter substrate-binding protein, partial [Candidatus Limnocylindria bacterium]